MPWLSGPNNIGSAAVPVITFGLGPVSDVASPPKIAGVMDDAKATSNNQMAWVQTPTTAGTSWTQLALATGNANSRYSWYDAANNRVVMALIDIFTGIASIGLVNLDNGSFSSIAGPNATAYQKAITAVLPNGNIVLALIKSTGTTPIIFWQWNGSSWIGPVNLTDSGVSSTIPIPIDIEVDSSNVSYISYEINTGSGEAFRVQTVDASGNLGPVCTIATGAITDTQAPAVKYLRLFNGQLWSALMLPSTATVYVYRSGPASALVFPNSSPVTFTLSTSSAPVAGDTYAGVCLAGSTTLYFIFNAQTGPVGAVTSDRIVVNTYSGSGDVWNGLVQVFDWVAHPPVGSGALAYPGQNSHLWTSRQLPDNTFGTFCDFLISGLTCTSWYTQWTLGAAPPPPLAGSCAGLASGNVGIAYLATVTASGGTPPYTFAIVGGLLPGGLSLAASTGVISGTPTKAGTFNFSVLVTDSGTPTHQTVTLACSIVISSAPVITCGSPGPPSGTVGVPYSFTFPNPVGGVPPFVWGIVGGSFPPGLVLNAQTGAVSGTPITAGTYNFTIAATATTSGAGCGTGIATCIIIISGAITGVFVDNEVPSGTINGVNTTFTLVNAPSPSTDIHLYLNGRRQAPTLDYTIVGNTITMINIPLTGDTLLADYRF